jgi:branched-chain amino acid aminotransferase
MSKCLLRHFAFRKGLIHYFQAMPMICHNGRFVDADESVLGGANPAFKWGEGLFETMKLRGGRILLAERHWSRLQTGLQRLSLNDAALQAPVLENLLGELAHRNGCSESARLRLQVYREGAGLGFVAEAQALASEDDTWNEQGWTIELFPDARIAADAFSMLKRSNYLPYHLAARFAAEQGGIDEAFLLNAWGRVCEGARSNLFIVRGEEVVTPPLSEGCVDGVMRRHLMDLLAAEGRPVTEAGLTQEDLLAADEIFLTNALKGIRWVGRFRKKAFGNRVSRKLYGRLPSTF